MKSLFSLKTKSSNKVRSVALEGRLVSRKRGMLKILGDMLYSVSSDFLNPEHIVNVGISILSAFCTVLAVFVNSSEYCTTTCRKNKKKKPTNSIMRIKAFMARSHVTSAIVRVALVLCPHLVSYIKNALVSNSGWVHFWIEFQVLHFKWRYKHSKLNFAPHPSWYWCKALHDLSFFKR